ncbi:hypothetical protein O9992_27835 [Vibrio lentus]|nr:hypothetical protein [Vibrio lentus]
MTYVAPRWCSKIMVTGSYTFLPNENPQWRYQPDVIVADEDGSIDETTAHYHRSDHPPVAGPTSYTIDEDSQARR